jgi:hypothetical protein
MSHSSSRTALYADQEEFEARLKQWEHPALPRYYVIETTENVNCSKHW